MSNGVEQPEQQAAKPPVVKTHILCMGSASTAFLTDLSAYPGLTYGKLLTLPTAEVVRIYGIT